MTVALVLQPHSRDIGGGMIVRRLLPAIERQSVGPFVFFDHFGPLEEHPGDNHDVRPHPHIGLATVTYLFEGAMVHRDSLGVTQRIEPGAINWMTAGRGIVHSERRPEDLRARTYTNHGLQLWAALPLDSEEAEPSFVHTPAKDIPEFSSGEVSARVLIGSMFGITSPVPTFRPTLYVDAHAREGGILELGSADIERAVYSVDKRLIVDDLVIEPFTLAVLEPGSDVRIGAPEGARYVVIGGEPLDGRRHLWWNFVSSSRERIEEAKRAWAAQSMGRIPGETEWIPLPG
jgi:redox-sensitive bicupin YhaK (pirin superfamily)